MFVIKPRYVIYVNLIFKLQFTQEQRRKHLRALILKYKQLNYCKQNLCAFQNKFVEVCSAAFLFPVVVLPRLIYDSFAIC